MKIVVINPSSDSVSYLAGLVVVAAGSSLDVPSGLWIRLYSDTQFLTDLRNSNLVITDGATNFRYPNSEDYLKYAIANLKFSPVRKDFSYSSTQTNAVIWTPTSGKKYVVTDLMMNIRNNTLGAITVTIFDDTNATGNTLYKATFEAGSNQDVVANLVTEFLSGTLNRSLKITTTGGLIISGNVQGYETE